MRRDVSEVAGPEGMYVGEDTYVFVDFSAATGGVSPELEGEEGIYCVPSLDFGSVRYFGRNKEICRMTAYLE